MTQTDSFMGCRRDMLMDFICAHLGTYHLLSLPTPVTVYRTTGDRDVLAVEEVTVTDWLCVLVRTEFTHPQARAVRMTPKEIIRKPKETVLVASGRLVGAFAPRQWVVTAPMPVR